MGYLLPSTVGGIPLLIGFKESSTLNVLKASSRLGLCLAKYKVYLCLRCGRPQAARVEARTSRCKYCYYLNDHAKTVKLGYADKPSEVGSLIKGFRARGRV